MSKYKPRENLPEGISDTLCDIINAQGGRMCIKQIQAALAEQGITTIHNNMVASLMRELAAKNRVLMIDPGGRGTVTYTVLFKPEKLKRYDNAIAWGVAQLQIGMANGIYARETSEATG